MSLCMKCFSCLVIVCVGSNQSTRVRHLAPVMPDHTKERCSLCQRRPVAGTAFAKLSFRGLCPGCSVRKQADNKKPTGQTKQCCRSCQRPAGKRGSFATLSKRGFCPDCCRKLREERFRPCMQARPVCSVCHREPGKKGHFVKLSKRGLCPDCGKGEPQASLKRKDSLRHCSQCQRSPGRYCGKISRRGLCPDCGKNRQKQAGLAANHLKAGVSSGSKRLSRAKEAQSAVKRLRLQTSEAQRPKPAAEMFSGSGRLSASLRKVGWTSEEWDVRHGVHMDMTQKVCQDDFFAKMRAGMFLFIWFGTCCKTFSRATGIGAGPQPVRSNEHVWGFPDLTGVRKEKALLANKLAKFTLKAILLANRLKLHWAVENPLTSMLWMLPGFAALKANRDHNVFIRVDYCQYGTQWQKPTAILSNCKELAAVGSACRMTICKSSGTRRICSRSGKRHERLAGLDDEGVWNTSHAEPYPAKLCKRIASTLDNAL